MNVKTFSAANLDLRAAALLLWEHLQQEDAHLPDFPQQHGTGEVLGRHLLVRFSRDQQGNLFACEVMDRRGANMYEIGFATPSTSSPVTFWRNVAGGDVESAPAPWTRAVAGAALEPLQPKIKPTFLLMASLLNAGEGAVALVENTEARAVLEDDLAYWRETARSQARVIARLQNQPASARATRRIGAAETATVTQPRSWTLRELGEWAALNQERIVILPRAIAAARKSDYSEPTTVFAALELLAGTYRLVRLGHAPREQLRREVNELHMEIGGSVEPSRANEDYFVRWAGRRRFLDQHLGKGGSRDSRFTMRIYFTWDDEQQIVVVGSLPAHLDNSLT